MITVAEYKRQGLTEHRLQVLVLKHLVQYAVKDAHWYAIPNAGKRSLFLGKRMKEEGLTAGVADLCIMYPPGRTVWLELKTDKGRQSLAQKAFEAKCRRSSHPYGLAYSLDEAIEFLHRHEVLK